MNTRSTYFDQVMDLIPYLGSGDELYQVFIELFRAMGDDPNCCLSEEDMFKIRSILEIDSFYKTVEHMEYEKMGSEIQ